MADLCHFCLYHWDIYRDSVYRQAYWLRETAHAARADLTWRAVAIQEGEEHEAMEDESEQHDVQGDAPVADLRQLLAQRREESTLFSARAAGVQAAQPQQSDDIADANLQSA